MPVRRVSGGYQWGSHGHVYRTRAGAERQGRAVLASGWREKSHRCGRSCRHDASQPPSYTRALLAARMTASRTGVDQYIYPSGSAWQRAAGKPGRMPYVKVHADGRAVRHERAVGDPQRRGAQMKKRARHHVKRRDPMAKR